VHLALYSLLLSLHILPKDCQLTRDNSICKSRQSQPNPTREMFWKFRKEDDCGARMGCGDNRIFIGKVCPRQQSKRNIWHHVIFIHYKYTHRCSLHESHALCANTTKHKPDMTTGDRQKAIHKPNLSSLRPFRLFNPTNVRQKQRAEIHSQRLVMNSDTRVPHDNVTNVHQLMWDW
jgi:hypothetical protein